MKKSSCIFIALVLLLSCKGTDKETVIQNNIIDIEPVVDKLSQLKASDYFEKVEYIPLETTDSCLIANNSKITILPENILVNTEKQCFLFDRRTGKFLNSIGHVGNDPQGYSSAFGWTNSAENSIYFPGWGGSLVKYDMNGKYLGGNKSITDGQNGFRMGPLYTVLNKDTLLAFYPNALGLEKSRIVYFNEQLEKLAEIPNTQECPSFEIGSISVIKEKSVVEMFGFSGIQGVLLLKGKDENISSTVLLSDFPFWHLGKNTYFKEDFNDTIYHVQADKLVPRYIFNLGKYQWPYKDRYNDTFGKEHINIEFALEGNRFIVFQFRLNTQGRYGIFDKSTGVVQISDIANPITDDMNGFMPLRIHRGAETGEFAGMYLASDVLEWFDTDAATTKELPQEVSSLKNLKEDDNPVVVIMHPKKKV